MSRELISSIRKDIIEVYSDKQVNFNDVPTIISLVMEGVELIKTFKGEDKENVAKDIFSEILNDLLLSGHLSQGLYRELAEGLETFFPIAVKLAIAISRKPVNINRGPTLLQKIKKLLKLN